MFAIDLCIVASRRPDLLSRTIEGFSRRILSCFQIESVLVNIDPIFGHLDDHAKCIDIIRAWFPRACIFEPVNAGFSAAVRRVWGGTTGNYVFHLEDDWLPLHDVGLEVLEGFTDPKVAQVSLHHADRKWDVRRKGAIQYIRRYKRFMGVRIPTFSRFPRFSTAPSIMTGEFARSCAARMSEEFDPEKQFYSGVNPGLEAYVRDFKNYIYSIDGDVVIRDLGRDWAAARGIVKRTASSKSTWTFISNE